MRAPSIRARICGRVGVMIYEMISGQLPFPATTIEELYMKLARNEPDPIRALGADDRAGDRAVLRARARTRSERAVRDRRRDGRGGRAVAARRAPRRDAATAGRRRWDDGDRSRIGGDLRDATTRGVSDAVSTARQGHAVSTARHGHAVSAARRDHAAHAVSAADRAAHTARAADRAAATRAVRAVRSADRAASSVDAECERRRPYATARFARDRTRARHAGRRGGDRRDRRRDPQLDAPAKVAQAAPIDAATPDGAPGVAPVVVDAPVATVRPRDAGVDASHRDAAVVVDARRDAAVVVDAPRADAGVKPTTGSAAPLDPYAPAAPHLDCVATCSFLGGCGMKSRELPPECATTNGYNGCLAAVNTDCDKFAACFLAPGCGPVGRGTASCKRHAAVPAPLQSRRSHVCVWLCGLERDEQSLGAPLVQHLHTGVRRRQGLRDAACTAAYNRCKAQ